MLKVNSPLAAFFPYINLHRLLEIKAFYNMKKLICGFFLFFLFLTVLKAQNIENNLEVMANRFPQERIYLHYDKSSYAPGETVWFKTYIMQAIYPSDDSKTVYID